MDRLIFRTSSNVCIYISELVHQHMGVSEDEIIMTIQDSQRAIEESIQKDVNCVISKKYDFIVGVTHCIEVPIGNQNIYFKQRGNRKYLSRMIKGALPQKTNSITIVLRKTGKNSMTIITGWTGQPAQPELGNISYFEKLDNPLTQIDESAKFWTTHALIEEKPDSLELYEDICILCNRLNMDIINLDYESLTKIIIARLNIELPKCLPRPKNNQQEILIEWLETYVKPLYWERH